MSKSFKKSGKVSYGGKSIRYDVNVFGGNGPVDYTGFGVHGKDNRADRRERKLEEKNVRNGYYD